jgi:EpsD family peptidyl-prolyl cis-trans isomerase
VDEIFKMPFKNMYLLILIIAISLTLGACHKKNDQVGASKADTQVVAKVNGDEITIYQVNYQLSRLGQMTQMEAKVAAKQVLSNLVEQQLLKQQALEAKLDNDPNLLQAMESTKRQLLGQAYLESLMAKAPKPSEDEIDTFYKTHPELFSNRRVFRLQELVVSVSKDKFDEAEVALKSMKDIKDVVSWVKGKNYLFTVNSNVKAAEQLPQELLKKLQGLKDGEILFVPRDGSLNIIQIAASETMPIARAKATPIIEQYFLNQNRSNLAKKEVIALNDKAKVEFLGVFSSMKKSDLLKPENGNSSPEKAPDAEVSAQSKSETVKSTQEAKKVDPTTVSKGLSGL